jgi:superfamily II DNA or RNA helicase
MLANSSLSLEIRDYQLESFVHCVRHRRSLFLSPTASGKSLIIYWLTRYYNRKTLIIVDSINLLNQLATNFRQYGLDDPDNSIHLISSGSKKNSKAPIYITTWQSATKQPKGWFEQFDVVIGDEAHRYKAKSLKHIMESLEHCKYRFGFTGSLDGMEVNQLTLEGLFGPTKQIVTTKDLIDQGHIADVEIKALILKYPDSIKKEHSKDDYETEISFLYSNEKRNKFIENLALSLKGNTILLFQRVDSHGIPLYDSLTKKAPDIPIYYVSGKVGGEDRERIRQIINTHERSIIVASTGVFSVGVDIPTINNIIIAAPTKSVIRVLQTIGRGLRKTKTKKSCIVFDIADDLRWKKRDNYTLKHFSERMKIYLGQKFKYKLYPIDLWEKKEEWKKPN